jgi:hypothetical protein
MSDSLEQVRFARSPAVHDTQRAIKVLTAPERFMVLRLQVLQSLVAVNL